MTNPLATANPNTKPIGLCFLVFSLQSMQLNAGSAIASKISTNVSVKSDVFIVLMHKFQILVKWQQLLKL